jgi:ABC-type amino acid transport system permease subunit
MAANLATQASATVVLWAISGTAALSLAVVLSLGSLAGAATWRRMADAAILLSRGVPTSLLVITAGLAALPHQPPDWLPNPFPGTSPGMSLLAWAVTIALAIGSAGHLAVIFRSGYRSLGAARLAQLTVLAIPTRHRIPAVAREAAAASLAPTGARMVHHLHNTAFAALFPVADLFGWIQQRSYETFEVTRYAAAGAAVYIVLSLVIWAATDGLERRLRGVRTSPRLLGGLR